MNKPEAVLTNNRTERAKPGGSASRRSADRLFTLLLVAAMILGIALLAYPSFSDYWNSFHQSRAVMTYAEHVSDMNTEEYDRLLAEARAYNERFVKNGLNWHMTEEERAEYNKVLDVDGTGVMGYITIQKINCQLPIYHGTEESVLQTSIGHLEGSSLPAGGESTHCLLSGHRGLPSARLFTDLDRLREGDTFTLTVLNNTLTYEVDHIWIVEPSDLSHLAIEKGKDYCTLITCTPYGVNTHRLLVRGHRTKNADGNAMIVADAIQIRPVFIAPFLAIPILALLLVYLLISTSANRRRKRDLKAEYLSEHRLKEVEPEIEDKDIIMDAVRAFFEKRR
ncbi:MAG: class C sortase [Lachnospiraceae bacterium]|nr:class C sortase [Lachnospiraceae bacterium]